VVRREIKTIRGFTPAAPLKLCNSRTNTEGSSVYPRVHTRGPIEAIADMLKAQGLDPLSAGSHPRPH